MHSSRRSVKPEAVFGQAESNKGYSRFRHFNNTESDKVMPDFAVFAVAFNLQKLHRKRKNTGQNPPGMQQSAFSRISSLFFVQVAENIENSTLRTGKPRLAPPENINEAAAFWDSPIQLEKEQLPVYIIAGKCLFKGFIVPKLILP
ncbi:MAG: transposase [Tannerella sp.]|jgi:hypothetical protein|nr:transposase [Tannerella sp.]